ncbi:MAG: multidrug efflux SMR transporter [Gemmataceae bacterium]|jgi:quaternary ammonium compound-resistance protein SugE|nr:multidrug efflux SMR transporter [Gemmataceae bacterium]
MEWIYLVIAGLLEVGWAMGLVATEGFTKFWPSLFTTIGMIASVFFLALAAQKLPIGTCYVIWTGIGAIGASILGIILFQEPFTARRIFFLALILVGVIGLKFASDK